MHSPVVGEDEDGGSEGEEGEETTNERDVTHCL